MTDKKKDPYSGLGTLYFPIMRRLTTITFMFMTLFVSVPVFSKPPPRLFNEPVKLDDAGRPLYNQWERQEYERRLRERQRRLRRPLAPNTVAEPMNNSGKIPGGKKVGGIPAPAINPVPTDDHTIDPGKFSPTLTQPDPVSEQPPTGSTPPHTQDYSF